MNIKSVAITFMLPIALAAVSPLHAQNKATPNQPPPPTEKATPNRPAQPNVPTPPAATVNPVQGTANPIQGMTNPIQGMTNPIQGMTTPPILPMGGGRQTNSQSPVFLPPQVGQVGFGNVTLAPGEIILVPSEPLPNEDTFGNLNSEGSLSAQSTQAAPTSTATKTGTRGGRTQIEKSTRPTNTEQQVSKQNVPPAVENGTPRDKVIEKLGNPTGFLLGVNGETLFFKGGAVVFVRNGVVATPGK